MYLTFGMKGIPHPYNMAELIADTEYISPRTVRSIILCREAFTMGFCIFLVICTLRLDFEKFTLLAGTGSLDTQAACQDTMTVTGVSNMYFYY